MRGIVGRSGRIPFAGPTTLPSPRYTADCESIPGWAESWYDLIYLPIWLHVPATMVHYVRLIDDKSLADIRDSHPAFRGQRRWKYLSGAKWFILCVRRWHFVINFRSRNFDNHIADSFPVSTTHGFFKGLYMFLIIIFIYLVNLIFIVLIMHNLFLQFIYFIDSCANRFKDSSLKNVGTTNL